MSVEEAWEAGRKDGRPAYLVGTPERLCGVTTLERLERAREAGRQGEAVVSTADETFPHVHPDHSLDVVLERFAESPGLLPVVSRAAANRVEGIITIEDITRLAKRRRVRRAVEEAGEI
jgi:CBS domain-containing protein